jgi:hypothetical protein
LCGCKKVIKVRLLYNSAYAAQNIGPVVHKVLPKNAHLPRGWSYQGQQHPYGRRFSRSVLTQKSIHLPRLHRKAKIIHGPDAFKLFAEPANLNNWGHSKA